MVHFCSCQANGRQAGWLAGAADNENPTRDKEKDPVSFRWVKSPAFNQVPHLLKNHCRVAAANGKGREVRSFPPTELQCDGQYIARILHVYCHVLIFYRKMQFCAVLPRSTRSC